MNLLIRELNDQRHLPGTSRIGSRHIENHRIAWFKTIQDAREIRERRDRRTINAIDDVAFDQCRCT
jgi:hypothetical protein